MKLRRHRRGLRGSTLADIGPAMWLLMIFFLLPFFDLISFGIGVASIMMIATWGSRQAGPANTFTDAQTAVTQVEQSLANVKAFAKLTPVSGNSGVNITVQVLKDDGSASSNYTFAQKGNIPNSPPADSTNTTPAFNTANSVYQYVVTANYNVLPLFNFSSSPVLNKIPGLGQAVPITYTTTANVEHPDGLQN